MSADLSRVRFDPLRDFSNVVLQQGRVLLDGDFNEFAAILRRRLTAETVDLTSFGPDPDHAGSAWVPRHTPDGFRISLDNGEVTIGRGRMYVDGLLAENHGVVPLEFDPLLAESTGSEDMPYLDQPWWNTPDPLPDGGTHLAYLDVWDREITHVEAPDLIEPAIGVDTTARSQTVWQVRLHPVPAGGPSVSCSTPDDEIPGWAAVISPSAGLLTVGTIEVDEEDDPCDLPPTGGYRGRENQTYRIEVHDGGTVEEATFKWSRENASIVQPVVEMISPTTLRLASVGRDDVLRISTGDWVEIIDDNAELNQQPGVMRNVVVDDATSTITFADPLPADLQPADADDADARHLRVKRWDQSGEVVSATGVTLADLDDPNSTGLIDVPDSPATQVVLEHGIVVSFDVAETDGRFRTGDHWIVAARTASTSVDELVDEPPFGIHHHYARLAVVSFPDSETSCRRLWPPLSTGDGESCDCTVCVDPESHASGSLTIQDAIDTVAETGGTICLHSGLYDVGGGVDLDGVRSVRIHGQGLSTMLVARGDAIRVTGSIGVTIEALAVVSGISATAVVSTTNCIRTRLADLAVLALGNVDQRGVAVRIGGVAMDLTIEHNMLMGRSGIAVGLANSDLPIGIFGAALRVRDNIVAGDTGIDLGGVSSYTASIVVEANDVMTNRGSGIRASGATAPGGLVRITGNVVLGDGPGIVVGPSAVVDDNVVTGRNAEVPAVDDGIVVDQGFDGDPGHVRITGNRVSRRGGTAIVLRTEVRSWIVKQNVVEQVGGGIAVDGKGRAETMAIENNVVNDVVAARGDDSAVGIAVVGADVATIATNTVRRVGVELVDGDLRAGITVSAVTSASVTGNAIESIGPREYVGIAAGVFVTAPFDDATVSANRISSGSADEPPLTTWFAVLIQGPQRERATFGSFKAIVPTSVGAVVLNRFTAFAAPALGQHVTMSGNTTRSGGRRDGNLIRVTGDVVVEGNQMEHMGFGEPVALRVESRSLALATNRARGRESMIVMEVNEGSFTAVGNITEGGVHLGAAGAGLPGPWDPLNRLV